MFAELAHAFVNELSLFRNRHDLWNRYQTLRSKLNLQSLLNPLMQCCRLVVRINYYIPLVQSIDSKYKFQRD